MSKTVQNQYAEGELVNVTIRGARVGTLDGPYSLSLPNIRVRVENQFGAWHFDVPTSYPGVDITRVAPAEWPPQAADTWSAITGGEEIELLAIGYDGGDVILVEAADLARRYYDSEALERFGQWRLLRRKNWTPATDDAPAVPEQVDERAAVIAGLRELIHLLESNPAAPAPNSIRCQHSYFGDDETQRTAIERDAAALGIKLESWTVRDDTGDTAISGDLLLGGHVLYSLYARVRGPELTDAQLDAAEAEPDTAPAGCECDDCLDERAAAAPLPHRVPADTRLSLDEALADADAQGFLAQVTS